MSDFDMKGMDDGQRIIAMMLAHALAARNLQVDYDYDYKKGVLVVDISGMPEQYCYHAEIRLAGIDSISVLLAEFDGSQIFSGVIEAENDTRE